MKCKVQVTNEPEKIFDDTERAVEFAKSKVYSSKDASEWVDHLEKNGTARYSYGFEEVELLLWSK